MQPCIDAYQEEHLIKLITISSSSVFIGSQTTKLDCLRLVSTKAVHAACHCFFRAGCFSNLPIKSVTNALNLSSSSCPSVSKYSVTRVLATSAALKKSYNLLFKQNP